MPLGTVAGASHGVLRRTVRRGGRDGFGLRGLRGQRAAEHLGAGATGGAVAQVEIHALPWQAGYWLS